MMPFTFIVATLIGSASSQAPQGTAASPPVTVDAVQTAAVPFTSNGCSGFREATYFSCCFVHDLHYWAGGTWSDRARADRALWRCVYDIGGEHIVADIGYLLVTLGAIPGRFLRDGWGRAWYNTDRGKYAALTADQRRAVEIERARVCRSLTPNPKTGWYRVDATREIRPKQARDICGDDPALRAR